MDVVGPRVLEGRARASEVKTFPEVRLVVAGTLPERARVILLVVLLGAVVEVAAHQAAEEKHQRVDRDHDHHGLPWHGVVHLRVVGNEAADSASACPKSSQSYASTMVT
eukprot:5491018-Heterocapsa_arctica.AAC.1